jgi:hypothetical protein
MAGNKLLNVMRQVSRPASGETTDLLFGTVTSVSPLKIKVDNRFEITSQFIILTSLVSDFDVELTADNETKQYKVNLGLKAGENVIMLRVQKGQKFIIIDRTR